jgi:hypothetical protein
MPPRQVKPAPLDLHQVRHHQGTELPFLTRQLIESLEKSIVGQIPKLILHLFEPCPEPSRRNPSPVHEIPIARG